MPKPCCECRWYRLCLQEYGNVNNLAEARSINVFVFAADCWEENKGEE